MPKIDADTVAEHVERQEQRVFESAIGLFVERGYEEVTFADIAEEVGLARNSLYRYYPGKAAILAKWIERELDDSVLRSAEILDRSGTIESRVTEWAADQIAYSRRPEHALLVSFATARFELDEETLRKLQASHGRLAVPLVAALRGSGGVRDPELTAKLIFGLVNQASTEPPEQDRESLILIERAVGAFIGG